jgi:hypothetical protein
MSWLYQPLLPASAELLSDTPPTVVLSSPTDTATITDTTPNLVFTGTDAGSNDISYAVQIDTNNSFSNLTDSTIGYTTIGSTYFYTQPTDEINLIKFTAPANAGNIYKLTARVYTTSGTANVKFLIYSDNAGAPDSLLATSSPIQVNTTEQWVTQGINYSFSASQVLWLGHVSDADIIFDGDNGSFKQLAYKASSYASPASTITTPTYLSEEHSIYATYTIGITAYSNYNLGFSGSPDNTDPFASGQEVTYTVQSALADTTTYYWRVKGIDPSGTNTYGSWSSTYSFYLDTSYVGATARRLGLLGVG